MRRDFHGEPRLLEWVTLILQFVLLGAVIAYGQVTGERQSAISAQNQQILRELQLDHQPLAGAPVDE